MKKYLDLENWPRKEHFHFFRKFEEPFFGVTVTIDCTKAYEKAKMGGHSFFTYYLHKTLAAVNSVKAFRFRVEDDKVAVYDQINASATISREDGSFGFSLIEYHADFSLFVAKAQIEIERVKNTPGLFTREFNYENMIHFSAIPWIDFTSLSHARSFSFPDSCPKISFGKMTEENGTRKMAISAHVHHGLMDGFHLGQFIDRFQELMNS